MNELRRVSPKADLVQIASKALELAIEHLQGDLPSESPPDETEDTFSLDEAMEFVRESYAARVSAARAKAGQPLLPFVSPGLAA